MGRTCRNTLCRVKMDESNGMNPGVCLPPLLHVGGVRQHHRAEWWDGAAGVQSFWGLELTSVIDPFLSLAIPEMLLGAGTGSSHREDSRWRFREGGQREDVCLSVPIETLFNTGEGEGENSANWV